MRTTNRSSTHMARTKKTRKDERSSCNTWPKQRNPIPRKSTTVQVKFTRQPFPESCNCLTTVSKNIHKFKLSSNYMDNISKTVDNTQNNNKNQEQVMILSCWDISFDQRSSQSHYSYIIGSYEYLSTKRPTTKQRTETKHYAEASNESTNVQLVTSDIKTVTTSETDDIEMQNSDMNISATAKLTSAKTLFYS